jgi:8-oxo-dGTP diphosphatase
MAVILLRHASAGDRSAWQGDDRLRPLDERGRVQAERMCATLRRRGVERVVSSPYVRCTQTAAPLGLTVELDDRLAEGAAPEATLELLQTLDRAVACTHGDVIENVLGRPLAKGAAVLLDGRDVVEELPAP